jgi:hypothetical protein
VTMVSTSRLGMLKSMPKLGIFSYPPSSRMRHEGGHAASRIMPSFYLHPLC